MSYLSKNTLDSLFEGIVGAKECALVHEAALMAWNIDNNLVPYAIDVLVSKKAFSGLARLHEDLIHRHMGNEYIQLETDSAPLRIWNSVGDQIFFDASRLVNCPSVGYKCLRPEFVLESLSSSPDFQYLLEQRAALAEVLYFDDMTDEQLMEFRSFVRGV